jgi:hypothetical protein
LSRAKTAAPRKAMETTPAAGAGEGKNDRVSPKWC